MKSAAVLTNEEDYDQDLEIVDLSLCDYEKAWTLQKRLQQSLIRGLGVQTLILCEHYPVLTHGKSADPNNLLASRAELDRRGVKLFQVERGGDYTYHGPGQLVAYPIIDLRTKKQDVGWYMRTLEQVIIESLQLFGITAHRVPGKTGVWTQGTENDSETRRVGEKKARKIASIGVRLSRWCTMHGLSLNVGHPVHVHPVDMHPVDVHLDEGFGLIHPCGLAGVQMTSMHQEKALSDITAVKEVLVKQFCEAFDFRYSPLSMTIAAELSGVIAPESELTKEEALRKLAR